MVIVVPNSFYRFPKGRECPAVGVAWFTLHLPPKLFKIGHSQLTIKERR